MRRRRRAGWTPAVRDAALVGAAQKVEHYEIAGYGTVMTYAGLLGLADAEGLLQQSLDEVKESDRMLTELAESEINVAAANGIAPETEGA